MLSSTSESSGLITDRGISSKQASSFQIASKRSVSSRFRRRTIPYTGHIWHMSFHLVMLYMPHEPSQSLTFVKEGTNRDLSLFAISASNFFFFFFYYIMSGKGHMAYNKAPTKEELRKWEG